MSTQNFSDLESARSVFNDTWRALYNYGPEKLKEWDINIKPLLKQQKKLLQMFGNEVKKLDDGAEMEKLNEVLNFYCPEGKIPQTCQCHLAKALSVQEKMNDICKMLLQKATVKHAQEIKDVMPQEPEEQKPEEIVDQ